MDATSEDLPEVLSFQHKFIQEMVAAYYIAEQVKMDPSFMETAFPTWEEVKKHQEVVRFTCGLLAKTEISANPVMHHVGQMLTDWALNRINRVIIIDNEYCLLPGTSTSNTMSSNVIIYESLMKESCVLGINPFLSLYPKGKPLAEVLGNTRIALINGMGTKDVLKDVLNVISCHQGTSWATQWSCSKC